MLNIDLKQNMKITGLKSFFVPRKVLGLCTTYISLFLLLVHLSKHKFPISSFIRFYVFLLCAKELIKLISHRDTERNITGNSSIQLKRNMMKRFTFQNVVWIVKEFFAFIKDLSASRTPCWEYTRCQTFMGKL